MGSLTGKDGWMDGSKEGRADGTSHGEKGKEQKSDELMQKRMREVGTQAREKGGKGMWTGWRARRGDRHREFGGIGGLQRIHVASYF